MKEQNVQVEDSAEKQGMCFDTMTMLYLEGNVTYNDQGVILLISQCQSLMVKVEFCTCVLWSLYVPCNIIFSIATYCCHYSINYLIVAGGKIAIHYQYFSWMCVVKFMCALSSFRLPARCWGDWPHFLHIHWQGSELQLEKIWFQDSPSWPRPSPWCEWMSASHQSLSLWAVSVPRGYRMC